MSENCTVCGLPQGVGKGNVWHSNGVITGIHPPYIRGTLYDVEELSQLFEGFSKRIGFDISRLVIEGKRKDAKRYIDALLEYFREQGLELPPPIQLYEMINRFARVWGLARSRVKEFCAGEKTVIEVEDVYNIPMYRGDIAGVGEAVEGRRVDTLWKGDSSLGVVEVFPVEGEPELEQRIESEVEKGIPFVEGGDLVYQLCPECNAPVELSRQFEWDQERARIIERETGKRYVLHNTNGIVAVVRSLRDELGEEVDGIMMEVSRAYAFNYYLPLREKSSLEEQLSKFPLRSWGRPVVKSASANEVRVRVVNPYCEPIVAGRIWGLFEAFREGGLRLAELSKQEGIMDIVLEA